MQIREHGCQMAHSANGVCADTHWRAGMSAVIERARARVLSRQITSQNRRVARPLLLCTLGGRSATQKLKSVAEIVNTR